MTLLGVLALLVPVVALGGDVASIRKAQRLEQLKSDLYKTDRAIEQAEEIIARSAGAPYVAELRFRLCELTVEKSRYIYHLKNEARPDSETGALASPEARLMKEKAVGMYGRLLREFPAFRDNDKVRFYLAHEQRELGQFDQMLKTLKELSKKNPKSPLRLEAEQIIGDHYFDQTQLDEAELHYREVLEAKESPAHDLARFKLGWIRVNQGNHAEALKYFEAAVSSAAPPGATKKALDVKREALLDAIYSYTEVKPGKNALAYFERLSDSRATYALALEKLAARYVIKEQPEIAVAALRRLLELSPDVQLDLERSQQLYDLIKAHKLVPVPADIGAIVRAAIAVRKDSARAEDDRAKQLTELEQMARDLATGLHLAAQKKDDRRLFAAAADAYEAYLSLFRPPAQLDAVMSNRADALYAARRFPEAARQFELLAHRLDGRDAEGYEKSAYGALLAHQASLTGRELERRSDFQRIDARGALKALGESFLARYPDHEHAAEVEFSVARAWFDEGQLDHAATRFRKFALAHPTHKDATVAGHLALDCYRQLKDFGSFDQTGRALLASRLPASFQREVAQVLADVQGEQLTELALKGADDAGDVVAGLLRVADEKKGEAVGKRALIAATLATREKGDFEKERELTARLLADHPGDAETKTQVLALARRAAETARFQEAAEWFEKAAAGLEEQDRADALENAGRLKLAMGDVEGASALFAAPIKRSAAPRKIALYLELAEAWLHAGESDRATELANKVLVYDEANLRAGAVLAEADPSEAPAAALRKGSGEAAARGSWHLAERDFEAFEALPAAELDRKIAALKKLQATYTKIAGMGAPEWAVASLWRLGGALQHVAEVVEGMPVPDTLDPEQRQVYKQALAEKVAPLREQAQQVFGTCLERAQAFQVFSDAVLGCRTGQSAVEPIVSAAARCKGQGCAMNPELQRKADRAGDGSTVAQLGVAWLERSQPALARLTLSRAVELNEKSSAAHGALGYAQLQLGDLIGAAAEYRRALETDPANDRARASYAALKCRVGDREGAREELQQIKDKSQLAGGDVDPQWKKCLEVVTRR